MAHRAAPDASVASRVFAAASASASASSSPQMASTLELLNQEECNEGSSSDDTSERASRPGLWGTKFSPSHLLWTPTGRSLVLLFLWVLVGIIGLTHCVEREERLYWVDTVYLMSQIITTVGYGDLPPPKSNIGFLFYAVYVLAACMLVAKVVSTFVTEAGLLPATDAHTGGVTSGFLQKVLNKLDPRFVGFLKAVVVWLFFMLSWGAFFVFCPGEERPVSEALYMGVITLTTIGFGDHVPKTEFGKLFASLWMLLGTGAFTIMIGKFGLWSFFLFNKLSVQKLDTKSLHRITHTKQFQGVASARAKVIEQLLRDFEFDKYHEVSKAYAEKISRNDFLIFMVLDMGLVDVDMVETLSSHFDSLDITGEGYIDRDDLAIALHDENLNDEAQSAGRLSPFRQRGVTE